jgi:hypothetical protein
MKVVFLLDNSEYVEVAPERLQIRQIADGVAALGIEVTVPLKNEDGTPSLDEKGQQKTQTGYRPFINYQVNLSIPKPVEAVPAAPEQVVEAQPIVGKKSGKAKRKAN